MYKFNKDNFMMSAEKAYLEAKEFAEKNDGKEVEVVDGIEGLGLLDGNGIDLATCTKEEDFIVLVDQEGTALTLKSEDNLRLVYEALRKCSLKGSHQIDKNILETIK